jgi:hypothetical protein
MCPFNLVFHPMIIALPTNAERVEGEGGSQRSCETDGGRGACRCLHPLIEFVNAGGPPSAASRHLPPQRSALVGRARQQDTLRQQSL